MGSTPRARHPRPAGLPSAGLPPAGLPSAGRVTAACAILLLLAHLLLAQLTLGLALAFTIVGRASRWRAWWLAGPAAAGLVWVLAVGPGSAAAGFAAGPAQVLGYLGRGDLLERLGRAPGPFAGAGSWLPRQLPIALMAGAAEAALVGWLDERRGSRAASRERRPGLVAAIRAALAVALIRSGAVVTRDGCALGVDTATGAVVQLRWPEIAGGLLVTGTADQEVTVTGLQLAHAALRRRKPLIVIDLSPDGGIARALAAACAATGAALRYERAGSDLSPVISERSAALVRVGTAEEAARACADVAALAAGLRRIGVDGDGLIWVTEGSRLPASAAAELIDAGRTAGLAVMIGTAADASAAEAACHVSAILVHRIAEPSLAAVLAAAVAGQRAAGPGDPAFADPGHSAALAMTGDRAGSGLERSRRTAPSPLPSVGGIGLSPELAAQSWAAPGKAAERATAARGLLSLRPGEFALGVDGPRGRVVRRGRLVSARLPRLAPGPDRARRRTAP